MIGGSVASGYKFDVFPLRPDPYHQMQFSRRVVRDIVLERETLAVPVATAEDTLLMKLVWYRTGGEDARLDRDYLTRWAAYLKVADLLEEAIG